MIAAGIDVGSLAAKAAIVDTASMSVIGSACLPTGLAPRESGAAALELALKRADIESGSLCGTVATGYGRDVLPLADWRVTEISCAARGAHLIDPRVRTVVDIGGQDSKVIRVDADGFPMDFALNDRCAAGTGRFLEVMAEALGTGVAEMGELARSAESAAPITRTCTVFAESEVVSLIAGGAGPAEIAAGLCRATALRIAQLAWGLGTEPIVMLVGGVAMNEAIAQELGAALDTQLVVPEDPQIVVATGAAVIAGERRALADGPGPQ